MKKSSIQMSQVLSENLCRLDRCSVQGGEFDMDVTLFAGHPVYRGHFPGMPVVPGVVTLRVLRDCLRQATGNRLVFSEIKDCKFLSALRPEQDLKVNIRAVLQEDGRLKAVITEGGKTVLKADIETRRT